MCCRRCRLKEETGNHLIFHCPALDEFRPEGEFKGEVERGNGKPGRTLTLEIR